MRIREHVRRILILDDASETRAWLAELALAVFPEATFEPATTVAEAQKKLREEEFDLALIDLALDDGSGLEVLEQATSLPSPPVSVVTTIFDDDQSLFSALRRGADGYLLKGRPPAELKAALQGILEGQPPLSPAIARRLLAQFAPSEREPEAELTPRETEVLIFISKGFTVTATAKLLALSPNTVAGYVKDVYRKLRVSSRAEAAVEAERRGLL